jgi:hypothetical protein
MSQERGSLIEWEHGAMISKFCRPGCTGVGSQVGVMGPAEVLQAGGHGAALYGGVKAWLSFACSYIMDPRPVCCGSVHILYLSSLARGTVPFIHRHF